MTIEDEIKNEIINRSIRDIQKIEEIYAFAIQLIKFESYYVSEAVDIAIEEHKYHRY